MDRELRELVRLAGLGDKAAYIRLTQYHIRQGNEREMYYAFNRINRLLHQNSNDYDLWALAFEIIRALGFAYLVIDFTEIRTYPDDEGYVEEHPATVDAIAIKDIVAENHGLGVLVFQYPIQAMDPITIEEFHAWAARRIDTLQRTYANDITWQLEMSGSACQACRKNNQQGVCRECNRHLCDRCASWLIVTTGPKPGYRCKLCID